MYREQIQKMLLTIFLAGYCLARAADVLPTSDVSSKTIFFQSKPFEFELKALRQIRFANVILSCSVVSQDGSPSVLFFSDTYRFKKDILISQTFSGEGIIGYRLTVPGFFEKPMQRFGGGSRPICSMAFEFAFQNEDAVRHIELNRPDSTEQTMATVDRIKRDYGTLRENWQRVRNGGLLGGAFSHAWNGSISDAGADGYERLFNEMICLSELFTSKINFLYNSQNRFEAQCPDEFRFYSGLSKNLNDLGM